VELQSRHTGERWDVDIEKAVEEVKRLIEEDKK